MSGGKKYHIEEMIFRYLQNKMSEEERHAFERQMQKDPFLAEAIDGFLTHATDKLQNDINGLNKEIKRRTKDKRRYVWWGAAASILILVVSSVLLMNPLPEDANQVAEQIEIEDSKLLIDDEQSAIEATIELETNSWLLEDEPEEEAVLLAENIEKEKEAVNITSVQTIPADTGNKKIMEQFFGENEYLRMYKSSYHPSYSELDTAHEKPNSNHIALSSYDDAESAEEKFKRVISEPKQMALMREEAPSEEASIRIRGLKTLKQYSVEEQNKVLETLDLADSEATPIIGWEPFMQYVKQECTHPSIGSPDIKTVVKVSFVIEANGNKSFYKILRGGSEKYNQEAIRIIEEGPDWRPAIMDSKFHDSVVKIRLVFKE